MRTSARAGRTEPYGTSTSTRTNNGTNHQSWYRYSYQSPFSQEDQATRDPPSTTTTMSYVVDDIKHLFGCKKQRKT
eukprot:scaffold313234_cov19-Prasinocladus_malaysianus.AAC.1